MTPAANTTSNSSMEEVNRTITPEILKYRFITGNILKSGGQRGSLTRCAQKLGSFASHVQASNPQAEAIESSKQELVNDLEFYQLELTKMTLLQRRLEQQVETNQRAEAARLERLETLEAQVQASRTLAQQAQETKRCYGDYEKTAQSILASHPQSSSELEEAIAQSQTEIREQSRSFLETNQLLEIRASQFQLLMQYMSDLKRSLDDVSLDQEALEKAVRAQVEAEAGDPGTGTSTLDTEGMQVDEEEGLYGDL
eukprot:Nitzschia sp. Nitz4//scaffold60_size111251//48691//49455//NITZ4_004148-RA/size111251-processed-gene-0.11-mRNA-1//1//CDS//3329555567//6736//frame0